MMALSLPNTISTGTAMDATQVQGNFETLRDASNADSGAYGELSAARALMQNDRVAGTWALQVDPIADPNASAGPCIYLDDADYTVAGMTTKLRVRALVETNGTVPAITFTFGLYPVTWSGAADLLTGTLGTVVSGSTVAIASPAANSPVPAVGTDFNVPGDGDYCLAVVTSATLTNNAECRVTARLQLRHV